MTLKYIGGYNSTKYNPLASNVTTSPNVAQWNGVYTLQQQAQALTTGQWATEPYAKNDTLLLHADGKANGSQNNTFLDSSTNNFTMTRNGTPTQGTFTPYGSYGSNYFDGSANTLSIGSASNWTWMSNGSNSWTVEFFLYTTTFANYQAILSDGSNYTSGNGVNVYVTTSATVNVSFTNTSGSAASFTSTGTLSLNTWNYVAITFTSSTKTVAFTINGSSAGSSSNTGFSYSSTTPNSAMFVGRYQESSGGYYISGYLSNLRISNVVLSNLNVIPTSVLTASASTYLLTCQSNRFIDTSTNSYAITVSGTPQVQRFSPFPPQYQYTSAVIGGSAYADGGSSTYLNVNTLLLPFSASATWTFEGWIYPINTSGNKIIIGQNDGSGNRTNLYISSGNNIALSIGGSNVISSSNSCQLNAWNHIVITRNGTTSLQVFINGVSGGTSSSSANLGNTNSSIFSDTVNTSQNFYGYATDFRITNSVLYTTTFTPPTAPLTTTVGSGVVQFLENFTNAGIVDSAMSNDFVTVGSAQVSTSVYKYGSGSLYFNGSTDYLSTANKPLFNFRTGDFTVECWVYLTSATGATYGQQVVGKSNGSTGWAILVNRTSSGYSVVATSADGGSLLLYQSGTLPASTWYHIAWSRTNGVAQLFLNGIVVASASDTTNDTNTNTLWVASQNGGQLFPGYIDDLRITNGYGRYTSNFTPPLVAFANQ
jgi:hypothetical protein